MATRLDAKIMEEGEKQRRVEEEKKLDELEVERSKENRAFSRIEEEKEKVRRVANDEYLDSVEQERSLENRAFSRVQEEEERQRRMAINDYNKWKEEDQKKTEFAWVNIKEEEERQRRMALAGYPSTPDREQSELNKCWSQVKEEEERSRRIAADNYLDEVENERRKLSKAEVIIQEEKERQRRIAEDEYLDELEKKRSEKNRAFSRILEEEEKQRRVAERNYKDTLGPLAYLRIPKEAAHAARNKYGSPSIRRKEAPYLKEIPSLPKTFEKVSISEKPIIAIFGGTGAQGGSVVKSLLNDGRFSLRILTRNLNSKKAIKFSKRGVKVFQGNMWNQDDLKKFLNGAYGCFVVTNFWDKECMGKEELLGKQIARIAREVGVRHFVWSTLPNVQKISHGKYNVPHFSDKARVNKYIKQLGFQYWTFVLPAFYYQNFTSIFAPKREDGVLTWRLPLNEESFITAVDIRDLGPAVLQIFNDPKSYHTKKIPLAGDNDHPQNYIIKLSLMTRQPAKVVLISPEGFGKAEKEYSKELSDMFSYFRDYSYYGGKYDWTLGKQLFPSIRTWEQYLKREMQKTQQEPSYVQSQ